MKRLITEQAVVGAGPVGVLGALSLANAGPSVTLLDGDLAFSRQFAGEWLHPEGLRLLEEQGIHLPAGAGVIPGKGFVVYPDDGSDPIRLENFAGREGVAFERAPFMDLLRSHCRDHPRIQFIPQAKVVRVERGRLECHGGEPGAEWELRAERIVGADGRQSIVRRAHGPGRKAHLISYMAGALLKGAGLPHEGFGHVILGGPGPILMYRIGVDTVRVCLDVPAKLFQANPAGAMRAHLERVPAGVQELLRTELEAGRYAVRPNQFRPRVFYGNEDMPLLGDAVGFQHPLTAMGMTLGFEDAHCLVRCRDFPSFERERLSRTVVPELLALALYEAFSRPDAGAASVRRAIYQMWRDYAVERERTLKLLCGEETNVLRFGQSFMRGAQLALLHALSGGSLAGIYRETLGTLGSIGKILCLLSGPPSSRILPFGMLAASSYPRRSSAA